MSNLEQPPKDFEEQDQREMNEYHRKRLFDPTYFKIMHDWQDNILEKKRKKQITKENFEKYQKLGHQPEKFVAHDLEITLPAEDANIFAVVHFQGLQHKVTKDDIIMLEKVPLEVGQIFVFDRVLLVGTKDYTSVGRPYVDTAKVLAVVEQNTSTNKEIVFKKKRRKGYQRNAGHKQDVTLVRVMKVLHNPSQEVISNYANLI